MNILCIFDLQDTLVDKNGKLLVNIKKLRTILKQSSCESTLYTIKEGWSLDVLRNNPDLMSLFKSILLVEKKSLDDEIWVQATRKNYKTLVLGDDNNAELLFAQLLKLQTIDAGLMDKDLLKKLDNTLKEMKNE